jgi:hypothetical protein
MKVFFFTEKKYILAFAYISVEATRSKCILEGSDDVVGQLELQRPVTEVSSF